MNDPAASAAPAPDVVVDQPAELGYEIISTLLRVINRINRGRNQTFGASLPVTLVEAEICLMINDDEGVTAVEISQRLAVSRSATSQTLSRLKDKGYVLEQVDASDAKRKRLFLTPAGSEAAQAGMAYFELMNKEVFGVDVEELRAYLRFVSNLDAFHSKVTEEFGRDA